MYVIDPATSHAFLAGMPAKFIGYTSTFPSRRIANMNDILYAATHLYAYGTPFNNIGRTRQPHYLIGDIPHLERILRPLAEKVWRYFNEPQNTANLQENFDIFHEELCDDFLNIIRSDAVYTHTYGNAQKMVNMLFKYLTCFKDYPHYADLFSYCHVPIDRNILKAFSGVYGIANITFDMKYQYIDPVIGPVEEPWSRLSKGAYKALLVDYRSALSAVKGNHSWLGFEYYIFAGVPLPAAGTHAAPIKGFHM